MRPAGRVFETAGLEHNANSVFILKAVKLSRSQLLQIFVFIRFPIFAFKFVCLLHREK